MYSGRLMRIYKLDKLYTKIGTIILNIQNLNWCGVYGFLSSFEMHRIEVIALTHRHRHNIDILRRSKKKTLISEWSMRISWSSLPLFEREKFWNRCFECVKVHVIRSLSKVNSGIFSLQLSKKKKTTKHNIRYQTNSIIIGMLNIYL